MIRAYRALVNFRGEECVLYMAVPYRYQYGKEFSDHFGSPVLSVREAANEEGDVLDLTDQIADYHTPEAEMMNREILQTVEASIAQLPDDMRQAITLREMDGLSYEEISSGSGLSDRYCTFAYFQSA